MFCFVFGFFFSLLKLHKKAIRRANFFLICFLQLSLLALAMIFFFFFFFLITWKPSLNKTSHRRWLQKWLQRWQYPLGCRERGNAYTSLAMGSYVSDQGSLGQCFLLGFCNMMHTQISKPLIFVSWEKGRGEVWASLVGFFSSHFLRLEASKRSLWWLQGGCDTSPRAVKGTSVGPSSAMCTTSEWISERICLFIKFSLLHILKGKIRRLGMLLEARVESRWRCIEILMVREEQLHRRLKMCPARISRAWTV